jgi:tetratricopeptide (TPR) repeat protein
MSILAPALVAALALGQSAQVPQEPSIQTLFEAGKYAPLLARVAAMEAPPPEAIYLAGQAARRLDPPDEEQARNWFARLAGDDESFWTFVGRSATAPVEPTEETTDTRLSLARHAAAMAPDAFLAQYHLGYVLAEAKDYAGAVPVLEKAAALNPGFAYAHYYAGLAHYQTKRVDRMANAFERFLKLAPEAPERPAIQALMRNIRR